MATALDRSDLLAGLRDLVALLHEAREEAGIRLVGGAALALRHFDRATTQDLDSLHLRPGRDTDDIRQLLSLCEVATLDAAEELYEEFYPGDALPERAVGMVERILAAGLPTKAPSPGPLDLGPPRSRPHSEG
ncbi:hypothetical protein [Rathayibacter iranicus]|uniref:Nucleotidyl transferase AbiEii toxin, Type IV TA system n=2 Tax=Rathayibacter iranicus TaxID=59737 RepID=A0AAD1AEW6_9MICO|nr:hypothetical protein [Rathayibacter iranicus]AZZ56903.1 hypothetical protein C7V51_14225 [Rathayibacter iranicus]MWV29501.1 hypothetical protein [Rathayibacter iranicus NCPPB 2253 = VKM Ac-1602]PPI42416.1 hypothetical protein C5E09_13080 [Rathayibacter iranicus]PPI57838.1 hypothetical protein C5E08_13980 [Rathayibacter iranicus]PPI68776.1 hypothetical protein C5E01_13035 [Rathayibacter iranicus]